MKSSYKVFFMLQIYVYFLFESELKWHLLFEKRGSDLGGMETLYDNMAEQGSHGGAGGAAVLDDAVDRAPFHDASGGGAAAGEGVGGVRRGAGGVLLVRVKRRRGEDPSDCITMRVKKRVDTKDETHGIQLRRVEYVPLLLITCRLPFVAPINCHFDRLYTLGSCTQSTFGKRFRHENSLNSI